MSCGFIKFIQVSLFFTFCNVVYGFSSLPSTLCGKADVLKSMRTRKAFDVRMIGSGSLLVTYGDVWKDVLKPAARINVQHRRRRARSPTFRPRAVAVRTFNAVGSAAANLWASLFRGPTDDEVDP